MTARKKAIATGKLFGEYDCYVLDGGTRVLSKRGALRLLSSGAESGQLERYIAALPNRFQYLAAGANGEEFILPEGRVGHAIQASTLVAICSAYVEALRAGELRKTQVHLAHAAAVLLARAAETGIAALIDEATGYDAVRKRGDLGKIFRDAVGMWELTFAADFVRDLCRLGIAGKRYQDWTCGVYPRPLSAAFHRIYTLILGGAAKKELKARNPEPRRGRNHHQWLTAEAHDILAKNMGIVRFCARTSSSSQEFWARLSEHYAGQQRLVYG